METMPKTLMEVIQYFSIEQNCINAVALMRWEDGSPVCPNPACKATQGLRNHYWLATQRRWKCYSCRKQFSVKVGTIFEDSAIGLDKWLIALWMLCNCKNGVSSYEIARDTGITQKSAWFVLQRLRAVLAGEIGQIGKDGVVELDETFIGGKVKNMHKDKRVLGANYYAGGSKAIVFGMLERGGKVKAQVISERHKRVIDPIMTEHVAEGANIHTDEFAVYPHLSTNYVHSVIAHAEGYVRDNVHTNGIENFWSLLKRSLGGTYISVEPFHLNRYVTEQVWRYNNRKDMNDVGGFTKALAGVAGKRLTYKELIARGEVRH